MKKALEFLINSMRVVMCIFLLLASTLGIYSQYAKEEDTCSSKKCDQIISHRTGTVLVKSVFNDNLLYAQSGLYFLTPSLFLEKAPKNSELINRRRFLKKILAVTGVAALSSLELQTGFIATQYKWITLSQDRKNLFPHIKKIFPEASDQELFRLMDYLDTLLRFYSYEAKYIFDLKRKVYPDLSVQEVIRLFQYNKRIEINAIIQLKHIIPSLTKKQIFSFLEKKPDISFHGLVVMMDHFKIRDIHMAFKAVKAIQKYNPQFDFQILRTAKIEFPDLFYEDVIDIIKQNPRFYFKGMEYCNPRTMKTTKKEAIQILQNIHTQSPEFNFADELMCLLPSNIITKENLIRFFSGKLPVNTLVQLLNNFSLRIPLAYFFRHCMPQEFIQCLEKEKDNLGKTLGISKKNYAQVMSVGYSLNQLGEKACMIYAHILVKEGVMRGSIIPVLENPDFFPCLYEEERNLPLPSVFSLASILAEKRSLNKDEFKKTFYELQKKRKLLRDFTFAGPNTNVYFITHVYGDKSSSYRGNRSDCFDPFFDKLLFEKTQATIDKESLENREDPEILKKTLAKIAQDTNKLVLNIFSHGNSRHTFSLGYTELSWEQIYACFKKRALLMGKEKTYQNPATIIIKSCYSRGIAEQLKKTWEADPLLAGHCCPHMITIGSEDTSSSKTSVIFWQDLALMMQNNTPLTGMHIQKYLEPFTFMGTDIYMFKTCNKEGMIYEKEHVMNDDLGIFFTPKPGVFAELIAYKKESLPHNPHIAQSGELVCALSGGLAEYVSKQKQLQQCN